MKKGNVAQGFFAKTLCCLEFMNSGIRIAAMIIEFDLIRTACELLGSSVRYARSSAAFSQVFHLQEVLTKCLRSSVVERVLRKDEVGSSILPEGNFFVTGPCIRRLFCISC